jgi:hypothetical protein
VRERAAARGIRIVKPTPAIMRSYAGNEVKFKYVITEEGEALVANAYLETHDFLKHPSMVFGAPVLTAGEGTIKRLADGTFRVVLNNRTGHYQTNLASVQKHAVPKFKQLLGKGFDVIGIEY